MKSCKICGDEFQPFKTTDRFCNAKCAWIYNREKKSLQTRKVKDSRSMMDFFLEIWSERPHVSELSGEPLLDISHFKFHWQFLHVLGHGSFPKYKFNKDNIILGLPEEHDNQTDYEVFNKKHDRLLTEYYK